MSRAVEIARTCIGVPYKHMGWHPVSGLDCMGLIAYTAQQLGHEPDTRSYGSVPQRGLLKQTLDDQTFFRQLSVEEVRTGLEPGDVLLMRFSKNPQHVALFTGDTIIHSYMNVGKVVEQRFASAWRARVLAAYRWVE